MPDEQTEKKQTESSAIPEIYDIGQDTNLSDLSKPGSKPIYSIAQIQEVIARVAENGTCLKYECEQAGLRYGTVWKRMNSDDALSRLDTRAREASLDLRVRELNGLVLEEKDVNKARLMCDNIKWEAARVLRKIYGEHIVVESKGTTYGDKSLDELKAMAADYALLKTEKTQVIDADVD